MQPGFGPTGTTPRLLQADSDTGAQPPLTRSRMTAAPPESHLGPRWNKYASSRQPSWVNQRWQSKYRGNSPSGRRSATGTQGSTLICEETCALERLSHEYQCKWYHHGHQTGSSLANLLAGKHQSSVTPAIKNNLKRNQISFHRERRGLNDYF